jgi:hypothetical protein
MSSGIALLEKLTGFRIQSSLAGSGPLLGFDSRVARCGGAELNRVTVA